ncbi:hypothetical protein LAZ67_2002824 [Cordylochernes scorpioides]|uniref:Mos1 transposase HTH domain-containing protein n=1 Tax=Cordylochernes scorpioides TaxID=51811 RepID=A0ABY6K321_9ARAC|nr:hypothetical protein LAZ67_2002824 [Cordylochernes scorpioides]
MDQRTCIKFCVKNEIKCADAFRMLTVAYGEATLDRSNVYRWYKMFSEGREDVDDEERAGRPSTSTTDEKINEVEKMILANRRITVREVAEDLNISIGSCHSIFINDLGMRRVAAKFLPKLRNCDQKQHRMNIANEMLDSVRDDPNLLQRVITGDEAWVYGYDVETKAQSSQWKLPHEPRPKKARQVRSNVKVLLTVFFDCRGVVHHEFLPQGRTVNKEYYLQVMRNLREAIHQKRPDLWKNKNWLLHHDNAPAHTSLLVRDFLAKNNKPMMPQPPYSPDLAPCDFFLFPKLKRPMKGRRYATLDEIKTASKEELKKILKNDFLKCFEDWKNRWQYCIISHGDYFEGDKIGMSPKEIYEDMVDTLREDAPSYSTGGSAPKTNIDKIHDLVIGLDYERILGPQEAFCPLGSQTFDTRSKGCKEKVIFGQSCPIQRNLLIDLLPWMRPEPITLHQSPSNNPCNGDTPVPLPPRKPKQFHQQGRLWCLVFWDSEGILLLDFLNKGQTITSNYYENLVKKLREAIKEKRRGKLSRKIVYHQHNAPSHRSLQAMAAIYDSGFELLSHAPYSPDLAPSDFHLFPHLKKSLSGIHFRSDEEVIDAVTSFFESLETSFFLEGIKALEHRWKSV